MQSLIGRTLQLNSGRRTCCRRGSLLPSPRTPVVVVVAVVACCYRHHRIDVSTACCCRHLSRHLFLSSTPCLPPSPPRRDRDRIQLSPPPSLLVTPSVPLIADLADDVELSASSDESVEALSLSKENEVEEVDPQQLEIQLGDSDEEEYTSDQNEYDNEDVNAEFDISPTSEDEMENLKIWFEDDVRLLKVRGERVVGGDLLPFLHLHHRQEDLRPLHLYQRQQDPRPLHLYHRQPTTYASLSQMASGSTPPPSEPDRIVHVDDETSHQEGEGSYNETMRARNHRFTEHSDELRARSAWTTTARANFKHLLYNVRRNAERVCASTDKNQWKEHGPVWMRKEYWIELCVIWGGEK
ncbi:hypothetical protein Taro_014246 [Colocasia esculenta]|uniref:Uncharacterized protein n=1 Tax=Colocasia esculenta TaxID=4460 RepID=A0A843UHP4_COLES|nr:hypothetical protein [Colocasia esculenta]